MIKCNRTNITKNTKIKVVELLIISGLGFI